MHQLSDFDFELPTELIAQHPAARRTDSRLLVVGDVVGNAGSEFQDRQFRDFVDLVNPGDLLVFNDSRVIKARLHGTKATGGQVEILVERIVNEHEALVLMRVSKKPSAGSTIHLAHSDAVVTVLGRDKDHEDRFRLQFSSPVLQVLASAGEVPLPPYITHAPGEQDIERYQTVYARTPGSVAAPTAGLHFDEQTLSALQAKGVKIAYVTLHVGTGTFAPVRTENIDDHRMHSEWYEISQQTADLVNRTKREGKRVIAVGTTSLRTLESAGSPRGLSAPRDDASKSLHEDRHCEGHRPEAIHSGSGETSIFIRPGFVFKVADALLTNFHLPRSTLLMLVAAFIGYDRMRAVYRHAVASRYRFFSYGDAMFCSRLKPEQMKTDQHTKNNAG